MIEAKAVVIEADAHQVLLKIEQRSGGCGRCHEPGGCQSIQLTQAFGKNNNTFRLPNTLSVKAGDVVRIAMDERAPVYAALLSYGLAVCMLIVGAAAGIMLTTDGEGDLPALTGGIAGLVFAVIVNRLIYRSRHWRDRLKMTMQRDLSSCPREAELSS